MASEIYFNIDNGHFKIWGYDLFSNDIKKEYEAITYYGRIGTQMQKLRKTRKVFESYIDAYDYIWNKIQEKTRCNGYYSMPNSQYFDAIINEKPIEAH